MLGSSSRFILGCGVALATLSHAANAFAGFSVVTKGDSVCRVEVGLADDCLPLFSKTYGTPSKFQIVEDVKARIAHGSDHVEGLSADLIKSVLSASVLTDKQRQYVDANYSQITVGNLGLADLQKVDGKVEAKFYATVFMRGRLNVSFTVQLEGILRIDPVNEFKLENLPQSGKMIGSAVHVTGVSDDKTELKDNEYVNKYLNPEYLRYIEKAARYTHYQIVGVKGLKFSDVNQQTIDDVKTVIAPVVFGRFIAEVTEKMGENIVNNYKSKLP